MRTPHQTNVFTETADLNLILEHPFQSRPLKNPVGLLALCNPFALAMSLNFFSCTLFIRQHLRTYFNKASLKRPEVRDVIISFHAIKCLPREKKNPEKP